VKRRDQKARERLHEQMGKNRLGYFPFPINKIPNKMACDNIRTAQNDDECHASEKHDAVKRKLPEA